MFTWQEETTDWNSEFSALSKSSDDGRFSFSGRRILKQRQKTSVAEAAETSTPREKSGVPNLNLKPLKKSKMTTLKLIYSSFIYIKTVQRSNVSCKLTQYTEYILLWGFLLTLGNAEQHDLHLWNGGGKSWFVTLEWKWEGLRRCHLHFEMRGEDLWGISTTN